jgi:hypothetical protein
MKTIVKLIAIYLIVSIILSIGLIGAKLSGGKYSIIGIIMNQFITVPAAIYLYEKLEKIFDL